MRAIRIVSCCLAVLLGGCPRGPQRDEPALPQTQAHASRAPGEDDQIESAPKGEQPNATEVAQTAFEKIFGGKNVMAIMDPSTGQRIYDQSLLDGHGQRLAEAADQVYLGYSVMDAADLNGLPDNVFDP